MEKKNSRSKGFGLNKKIEEAKRAAIEVLIYNSSHGHIKGLPRTAAWGYPEPYTRDLLISSLGMLVSKEPKLIKTVRNILKTLAVNQSRLGHIPSFVHDPDNRGASDTTPLFLLSAAIFRLVTGEKLFLKKAVDKGVKWMEYQSPSDRVLVAQLPTTDWRDEQWVLGYGLFVNTIVYSYLRLLGNNKRASELNDMMSHFSIKEYKHPNNIQEGLAVKHKPYYSLWSFKIYNSERFDLLGNSIAILSGMASHSRGNDMISWIEHETSKLMAEGALSVDLPPNFFPYIKPGDTDWLPRYEEYNRPGEYHNGGIWPFISGFYIAALIAAKRYSLAREKLEIFTDLIKISKDKTKGVSFGFNEWFSANDGKPKGEDWQTWSAAMYLYAATCVEEERTPFFDEIRGF